MIEAKVIADSKSEFGPRITTMICTFPRFLLAEFNTHRMFSRNSASSRAIKSEKLIRSIENNPVIPKAWMKDHPGMQGNVYYTQEEAVMLNLEQLWLSARNYAIFYAKELGTIDKDENGKLTGVTKQITNRLLEPFMNHTVLVTATEWENFFSLRAEGAAEIHFQELAEKMLEAMNSSEPKLLKPGEWHTPFLNELEPRIWTYMKEIDPREAIPQQEWANKYWEIALAIATTRCARISFLLQDKITTIIQDLEMHGRLRDSGHWSAFEHCARAMSEEEYKGSSSHYKVRMDSNSHYLMGSEGWCGNFRGFIQYRKLFENENRSDSRLIKK